MKGSEQANANFGAEMHLADTASSILDRLCSRHQPKRSSINTVMHSVAASVLQVKR